MNATLSWQQDMKFQSKLERGSVISIDASGDDLEKPTPMELVLSGLGGCSSVDVVEILKRGREDITDVQVKMTSERAPEAPKVFTAVHLHFEISGNNVSEAKAARAVDLSMDKYCSVAKMLEGGATLTHSLEVLSV